MGAEVTEVDVMGAEVTEVDVIGAEGTEALLYIGLPTIFRVTEVHSFWRPLSNLTSHLFSPLASIMAP